MHNSFRIGPHLCSVELFHTSEPTLAGYNAPVPERVWNLCGESVLELKGACVDCIGTVVRLPLGCGLKEDLPVLKEILETANYGQIFLADERYHKLCMAITAGVYGHGDAAPSKQAEWSHQFF